MQKARKQTISEGEIRDPEMTQIMELLFVQKEIVTVCVRKVVVQK